MKRLRRCSATGANPGGDTYGARTSTELRVLRPRSAAACDRRLDLHLRVHFLCGVRLAAGECLPELRWRFHATANPSSDRVAARVVDRQTAGFDPAAFAQLRSDKHRGAVCPGAAHTAGGALAGPPTRLDNRKLSFAPPGGRVRGEGPGGYWHLRRRSRQRRVDRVCPVGVEKRGRGGAVGEVRASSASHSRPPARPAGRRGSSTSGRGDAGRDTRR